MEILKEAVAYDACEWGVRDGELLHISQVDSGTSCNCCCPDCGDVLIAKKGEVNAHHFAHQNLEPSNHCGESLLHLAAKECLSQLGSIMAPSYRLQVDTTYGSLVIDTPDDPELIVRQVVVEVSRSTYRPDCTIYDEAMRPIDIEIKVSHEVDATKKMKVQQEGIEMIEIDLSSLRGKSITHRDLLGYIYSIAPRHWIYKSSRLEYKLIVNAMIKRQEATEARIDRGWKRSYRKWCEEVDRLNFKLRKFEKGVVTSDMTDDEAVDALGQAALNRNG